MNPIIEIISSKIVISVFFSIVIAQIIKSLIHLKKTGSFDWRWLFRDAGMPSAHTATVTALTFAIYLTEGVTTLLLVCGILSSLVIRDVLGDKIFAEKTENVLNRFFREIKHSLEGYKVEWKHLIGHTVREVVAGFVLGIAVTLIVYFV